MNDDIYNNHPSFGVVHISRVSCGGNMNLFGSSILHSNFLELTISRAEEVRSEVCGDRYYEKDEIVRVSMSASQFAEMITTMNHGSGVPVTIDRVMGEKMPACPGVSKRMQHSQEFKKRMREFAQRLKNDQASLQELLKKDKLSKEDKRVMKHTFEYLTTEIENNIPFFEEQFEEQMDKTVTEGKAEIENFITHAIQTTGIKALNGEYENTKDIKAIPVITIVEDDDKGKGTKK
ncbi:MAG: hypothetical protein WC333_02275 [Dehalococcoidia bacterium]|jgi:predicted transcriptional regulator